MESWQTLPVNASPEDRSEALAAQNALASDLMLKALNSKDASVTGEVAHNLNALTGHLAEDNGDMWVWRLAACKRDTTALPQRDGLHRNALWIPSCYTGEAGIDYIRRKAAEIRPNVDSEADELLARLNRGEIERQSLKTLLGSSSSFPVVGWGPIDHENGIPTLVVSAESIQIRLCGVSLTAPPPSPSSTPPSTPACPPAALLPLQRVADGGLQAPELQPLLPRSRRTH